MSLLIFGNSTNISEICCDLVDKPGYLHLSHSIENMSNCFTNEPTLFDNLWILIFKASASIIQITLSQICHSSSSTLNREEGSYHFRSNSSSVVRVGINVIHGLVSVEWRNRQCAANNKALWNNSWSSLGRVRLSIKLAYIHQIAVIGVVEVSRPTQDRCTQPFRCQ